MFCFRNKKKTTIKPEYVSKAQNENTIQVWENKKVIHTVEFDDISKYKCKKTNNNKLKAKKVF